MDVSKCNNNKPIGAIVFGKHCVSSFRSNQVTVFLASFLAYASYRAARKTVSVVKSVLDPVSSAGSSSTRLAAGWAPFNNGSYGASLLGVLDVAFLTSYALGTYFSGQIADRMDQRILFVVGMIGSGAFALLFGVGYWGNIHSFYYYVAVQILAGLFQSTGWPAVIPVVRNWVGKKKLLGVVMGIWNGNSAVGDVTGALMASTVLSYKHGWGWCFLLSGILTLVLAVFVFFFMPVSPESVGFDSKDVINGEDVEEEEKQTASYEEDVKEDGLSGAEAVGFIEACKIPGVVTFAFALFFCKFVATTFNYWLPYYISHTAINGQYLSSGKAGILSTVYDIGGTIGGILAGYISDRLQARAITVASFTYLAIPSLYMYRTYGYVSLPVNIVLMFCLGMFVGGSFSLISTAVSADLGTHKSLKGNPRAVATVTGIINATGSVGAALGPLLTGYISGMSWNGVFVMLMGADLVSGLLLSRLVFAEVVAIWARLKPLQK